MSRVNTHTLRDIPPGGGLGLVSWLPDPQAGDMWHMINREGPSIDEMFRNYRGPSRWYRLRSWVARKILRVAVEL